MAGCRRSTAFSCRSISSSASLDASRQARHQKTAEQAANEYVDHPAMMAVRRARQIEYSSPTGPRALGAARSRVADGAPRAIPRGLFFRGGEQPADAIGVRDDVMDGRDAGEPGVCRHERLSSCRMGRCGQDRVERAEARSFLEQA